MKEKVVSLTEQEQQKYEAWFGQEIGFGEKPALLIIDFIYGFTDPKAPFGANMDKEVETTAKVLHLARQKGINVVFTTVAYDEEWIAKFSIRAKKLRTLALLKTGSRLVEIDGRLKPLAGEYVCVKRAPSAFFGTYLAPALIAQRVDTVIITGCITSGCIRATVVDANSYGFRPIVPREGSAPGTCARSAWRCR